MERGSLMLNTTTFVGLDVHARSIKAVALDAMTGEVRSATFAYDAAAVAEWVGSLDPAAKCVYEWIGYTKLDSFVRAGRVRRSPWRTQSTPGISPTSSSGR